MSTRYNFDCDICPAKGIALGRTLVFENDMSGNTGASICLKIVYDSLINVPDAPKVTHICQDCIERIENPQQTGKGPELA